jgi:hypothetical protein
MFSPADMTEDQHAVAVTLQVPDALVQDEKQRNAMYTQAMLVDGSGVAYPAGVSMIKGSQLTYLYAIPNGVEADTLALQFINDADSSFPKELIGGWEGNADDIHLTFTVSHDGTGSYTFEQSGYTESYDFTMEASSGTFAIKIPEDNKLQIVSCEGTYSYADDVLTLDVCTTFANGRQYAYSVPCRRAVPSDAAGAVSDNVTLTTTGGTVTLKLLESTAFAGQPDSTVVYTRLGTTKSKGGSEFWAGSSLKLSHMRNTYQYEMPMVVFGYESSLKFDELTDALDGIAQKSVLTLAGSDYPVSVVWITENMACFIFDCPDLNDMKLGFVVNDNGLQILQK